MLARSDCFDPNLHKEISSVPVQQILNVEACRQQDQVKAVFYAADLQVLSYDGHGEVLVKKPGVSSFIGGCLAPFVALVVHLEFVFWAEILEEYLNGNLDKNSF